MKRPDDPSRAHHIIDAAEKVLPWTRGKSFADFAADEQLQAAVLYEIQIVGEAASRLSSEFRGAHADVPWPRMIALRNIIAHAYMHVDTQIIWRVMTERLPQLVAVMHEILPPADC